MDVTSNTLLLFPVHHGFKTGSITARKYALIASGGSCIPWDSHHPTVSTKDEEMWFTR